MRMVIHLNDEQRRAVAEGNPVRVAAPECGNDVVLIRADEFERVQEILQDELEQAAFRDFARRQAIRLAADNPY